MRSLDKVALALEAIPFLARTEGMSIETAAEHFGITPKQLYSVLEVAVCCGLPGYGGGDLIDIDIWDGSLSVYEGHGLEQPLRLSGGEIAALTLALRALEQVPGFVSSDTVHSILEKLAEAESEHALSAEAIQAASSSAEDLGGLISTAYENGELLTFDYVSGTGSFAEAREVLPITMMVQHKHAYLVGWDVEQEALRRFRFDRMSEIKKGGTWEDLNPVTSLQVKSFIESTEAPHTATVRIVRDAAWLADRLGVADVKVTKDYIEGTLGYYSEEWLERTGLRFGQYLRIIEPSACENIVEASARAALARYTIDKQF